MSSRLPGYRLVRHIGRGARTRISVAVELATGRSVAVKHILRKSAEDDPFLKQVETEHEVGTRLDHPHLRRSYAIHRIRQRLAVRELLLVMEYIDGYNLEQALPNRLNTFLMLFRKVALGLDALHEAGFVHSDVKPINIMLGRGGIVKVIDFGQACPMGHRKERIQGTPDYIAPEQVRRLPLDRRTDVFGLGATMYWVLTSHKYPTELRGAGEQNGATVVALDKPIAPIELNDKIPGALSRLVMDCCRARPADRPSDLKQVEGRLAMIQKLWKKRRETMRTELLASRLPAESAGRTDENTV